MLDRNHVVRSRAQNEALKQWGYRLDGLSGEIPAKKLVDAAYDWVAQKTNEARLNEDYILDYFRKRVPIYFVRYGIVHAILSDYEHFAQTGKLSITKRSVDFARLVADFILYMQMYMFGQQVKEAQERVAQNFVPCEKETKKTKFFEALPDEFTVSEVSASSDVAKQTVQNYISQWVKNGYVQRQSKGRYKKLVKWRCED
jgi:acyl-homoserine lactone acylase PvdQ